MGNGISLASPCGQLAGIAEAVRRAVVEASLHLDGSNGQTNPPNKHVARTLGIRATWLEGPSSERDGYF
jgi:hypothetical protein